MDLRAKPPLSRRFAELLIRFRLVLLLAMAVSWWIIAADWRDMLSMVLGQAERNAQIVDQMLAGQMGNPLDWIRFGFVVILFLVLRSWLGGISQGIKTLLAIVSVGALCWALEGSAPYLPVILSAVLVILVTLFFFARNAWLIASLAAFLTLTFLAAWIPGVVDTKGLGWQVIVALALADLVGYMQIARKELSQGRPATGAVVIGVQQAFPQVLASAGILVAADVLLYLLEMPTLQAGSLESSILADLGYILAVLVLGPVLFSLSPLNRVKAKSRTLHPSK